MKLSKVEIIKSEGVTAKLCENISKRWLTGIAETNPAILTVFRDRDLKPYRDLLAWTGEFPGKYLTSAYFIYKFTKDRELKKYVLNFIEKLISYQDGDGYIGCYSKETRFTGALPQTPEKKPWTWDVWNHYHIAFGLLLWYHETKKSKYYKSVLKIADIIIKTFYGENNPISEMGSTEMNLSVYHLVAILYNDTKDKKYMDFALKVENDMKSENCGNWLENILMGREFYQCQRPRWESMHLIMGFAEMYKATNDQKYFRAIKDTVKSILKTDVHNTGGFSTGEQATGNPFENGTIETCCVVAFNSLVLELYKLEQNSEYIDFLEISHYNSVMGAISPSGLWATYNTPMEGEKCVNFHGCDFQSRPGSPMLNCCSVNFGRGIGEVSEWAIYCEKNDVYINFFESGLYSVDNCKIEINGNYPYFENVRINILENKDDLNIYLRIPKWSRETIINSKNVINCCGQYVKINGHNLNDIKFDFSYTFLNGDGDYKGFTSIYRGPVLLCYDICENSQLCDKNGGRGFTIEERLKEIKLPPISKDDLNMANIVLGNDGVLRIILPSSVVLCDFYMAGQSGTVYKTWFKVIN